MNITKTSFIAFAASLIAANLLYLKGLLTGEDAFLWVGLSGIGYIFSRAIRKRGLDMNYSGFKTTEAACLGALYVNGIAYLFQNVSGLLIALLLGVATAVYSIARGLTIGRVVRSNTQVLRI